MSKEEIVALVKATVSQRVTEEFAKWEQRQQPQRVDPKQIKEQVVRQLRPEIDADRKAERAAVEQAEQAAREKIEHEKAEAIRIVQQQDEAVSRFLLLPHEMDRVEGLKEKLAGQDIWALSRQDLDFATGGLAAPLLHDALVAAAERYDDNIELDVLARKADLSPEEKIQMATMLPVERQQLLMFTEQFEEGPPSVSGDRFIREYIGRYPFIRKILLAHLREAKKLP